MERVIQGGRMLAFFVVGRFYLSMLVARSNLSKVRSNASVGQRRSKLVSCLAIVASLLLISSYAQAAVVSGTVWNDINADTLIGDSTNNTLGTNTLTQSVINNTPDTYGDPTVPDAGVENGYEAVTVCLNGNLTVPNAAPPPTSLSVAVDRCTTTGADGSYSFDLSDVDPTSESSGDLSIDFIAPSGFKFSSDDPAGDNDADQQAVAPTPPDPWTATIPLTGYDASNGDVTDGTDAGLRPLPEITIAYVDLNANAADGVQGIETGTPAYNTEMLCATTDSNDPAAVIPADEPPTLGDDCHKFDDTVRTNDLVTITPSITLDNAPSDGSGIDNVILEMQFTPVGGADLEVESASSTGIPTSCATSGVDPISSVTKDPTTGVIILICNMGNISDAQVFAPISIKPTGDSPNGSSFTTEIRAYAADNDALPSPELPAPEIAISAAPKFDLSKNNVDGPPNSAVLQSSTGVYVNPITGVQEAGRILYYELSVTADSSGKGSTSLTSPMTFEEIIDPRYKMFGAMIVQCLDTPYQGGANNGPLPTDGGGGAYQANATADSGSWTCDTTGADDTVTITGADTSGDHYPTEGNGGQSTAPYKYVATGRVHVFYPFSAFYRYAGPDGVLNTADDLDTQAERDAINDLQFNTELEKWQAAGLWEEGDDAALGTYPTTNCVGEFDPDSADGTVSNFGTGFEPGWDGAVASGNNCRERAITVARQGNFAKWFGQQASQSYTAPGVPFSPQPGAVLPGGSGINSGDWPVVQGQNWTARIDHTARASSVPWTDVWLCDAIDNATYKLAPVTAGSATGLFAWNTYQDNITVNPTNTTGTLGAKFGSDVGWILEYGSFTGVRKTWQNNHSGAVNAVDGTLAVDASQQQAAALDCGEALTASGDLVWSTTIDAASAEDVVMVRARPDPNINPIQEAGDDFYLALHFEARETFYSPDFPAEDGQVIPDGTISANNANFGRNGSFGLGSYDPTNHTGIAPATTVAYGDRVIHRAIRVAIEKGAYKAVEIEGSSTVGDDDLFEVFAGDPIMWSLTPSVFAVSDQAMAEDVTITDVLPVYTSYAASCSPPLPAGVSGPIIFPDTPNTGETTLIYSYDSDLVANVALEPISICANTDAFAPAPTDVLNEVIIEASNVGFNPNYQEDDRGVRLLQAGRFAVRKDVDFPLDFQDQDQVWSLFWANTSEQVPFGPPDIIDVLPYGPAQYTPGDGPGALAERENFASDYAGTLGLVAIPADPTVSGHANGPRTDTGQWWVSCDDPNTINPDASDATSNGTGSPADPTTGSTTWLAAPSGSTANPAGCALADVTAIRWVSSQGLLPQETGQANLTLLAASNAPNDIYVNRYTGYVTTFLNKPVRSNEPFVQVIGFSIGDLIWLDINGNGVFDDGTDVPAPAGVTVNLFDSTDTPVDSTVTDADGRWFFEGVTGGQFTGGTTYVAGSYYVTLSGLPTGWAVNGTATADPNTNLNEDADHHTIDDAGVIRSAGLMELSASVDASGLITGDEPTGDNVEFLGDPLIRDDLTNFTLDLMFAPEVGNISVQKVVQGGGPLDGWQFALVSADPALCPVPTTVTNPATTDATGLASFSNLLVNNTAGSALCSYTITEIARAGWTLSGFAPVGPYNVAVGSTLAVQATNVRDVGNIEVTKTVNGADAPAGWEFTLTSLVAGCDIPATVTNPATTADGSGGTVTFTGVPTRSATPQFAQCTYQVAETAQTGWTQQTAAGDLTGLTVTAGQTTDVAVVNNANPLQAQVAKSVTGVASTLAWEFGFSLTTTGAIDPTLTSTDALSSGTGSSTSTDLVTWGNIQPGQTYVLSEMLIDGYVAGTMSCTGVTDIDSAADTVTFVAPTTTDLNTATFEISCAISNAASPVQAQVTKTVSGVDANLDWSFGFSLAPAATLTSPDLIVAGTGSTTSTDVVSWGGLIPGTRYVLTETVTAGYEVTTDLQCANLTDLDTDPNTVTFDAPLGDTSTTTVDVSCTITNTAYGSDLQVTKTVSTNDTADWMFEFTLTPNATVVAASPAVGNGSGTAVVSWSDLVPGTEYVLAETPTTGYTAGSMVCTGVTDTDGDNGNASVTFLAPIGDANDPTTTFEVECAITNQQWPDLVVSKAVTPEEVAANGTLTYTITAQNDGILPATDVVLSDVLPNDLGYVSDTPSQGSYDSSTGEWDVGTIVGGASSTLTIVATFEPVAGVCSATATNTVTVSEQGEVDFDTSNHSDSAAVSLVSLALTKQLSAASPVDLGNGSQQVTYEFTLVNNGAQDMSSLQINENLAAMIDNPNDNDAVFVVTRVVSPDATLTPNASFDGAGNLAVLSGSDTLVAGATGSINVELELTPDTYFGPFVNSASASGETANGTMVTDLSENNASPTTSPCVYDEPTPLTLSTPSTPITLGWFKSENVGASVVFNWETELEVSNAGFIISAQGDDGQWVELTTPMLASQGDSVKPQNYQHEVVGVSSRVFRITDVSNTGKLKHHGPFELGKEYGVQSERKATDWQRIQQEQERREQQRLEQLKDDLQKRLQSSRSGNNWLSGAFAAVMGVLVPAAHAADLLNFEIEEAGIYRVSDSELRAIGLDLRGIDLARIGLEVDNTLAPVNIVTGSQSSTFTTGSYIEFPAKGKKTLYTGVNRYTLTLDEGQLPIATNDVAVPFKGAATSYLAEASYAEQNRYTQLSPSESDSWYADRLSAIQGSAEKTIGLTLDNQANALSTPQSGLIGQSQVGAQEGQGVRHKPSLDLELWGASALPGNGVDNPDHHVVVALNGVEVINERFDGVRVKTINQPLADIGQGANLVKITLPNEHGYPFDMVNIDRVSLLYPRRFVAQDEGQSLVFESSWDKFRVRGLANSEVVVYRVSQQGSGQVMTSRGVEAVDQSSCTNADGCMVVFAGVADGDDADYFVSTQAGVKSPTISIAPAGEALFAGGAEVLIVAHPDFIQTSSGALEGYAYDLLASYSSVDIVSTDSIYAEYSGHVMDAEAIARYVADAYAQRGTRHLIIVGGDVYDYHNNLNSGAKSFVPSKYVQIAQNINSVPSDSSYADVDGDFVPDMTVTRLPVRTEAELNTLLDKRQDFLNRSYQNTAVFAADADDSSSYSFDADAESIAAMLGSQWQIDRAYVESDGLVGAKQSIVDGINSGASITSFFGHSSMDRWSVDGVFNGADAASLLNSGKPTVVTQWGCWNTFHVSPTEDSMAHRLLVEGDQGAVVVMGASSLTKADAEKRMAELLFARLTSGMRIADAVLSAKQALAQERPYQLDILLGWAILGPADMTVN